MSEAKNEETPKKKRNPRISDREWDLANEVVMELKGKTWFPITEAGLRRVALLLAKYREEVKERNP